MPRIGRTLVSRDSAAGPPAAHDDMAWYFGSGYMRDMLIIFVSTRKCSTLDYPAKAPPMPTSARFDCRWIYDFGFDDDANYEGGAPPFDNIRFDIQRGRDALLGAPISKAFSRLLNFRRHSGPWGDNTLMMRTSLVPYTYRESQETCSDGRRARPLRNFSSRSPQNAPKAADISLPSAVS